MFSPARKRLRDCRISVKYSGDLQGCAQVTDLLVHELTAGHNAGPIGIALAVAFLLASASLLPPGDRKRLRTPLLLLLGYFAVAGARSLLPLDDVTRKPLTIISIFLLWGCVGHAGLLLWLDVILGRRLAMPLPRIFRDIIQLIVYAVVVMATMNAAGVEPGSLLAGSALVTAVIGLSLQDTLGNVFAGLSIQAQRPFEVGDFIQLADSPEPLGCVIEINWRATKLVTNDQVEIIVPNGTIAKASIRNLSKPAKVLRRSIQVHAAYAFSPDHVREVLLKAILDAPGILREPKPTVIVREFDPDGAAYVLRYFMEASEHIHVMDSMVRERIWYGFRRAGIDIPYAQRDVHMYQIPVEDQAQTRAMHISRRQHDLRRVDLFDAVSDELLGELAESIHTRRYAPNEIILRRGDEGDQLFIIEHGEVAISIEQDDGQQIEIARLGKGKFFGEMSLMTGAKRTATVKSTRECALLVVGKGDFQSILHKAPEIAERISATLAKRQAQMHQTTTGMQQTAQIQQSQSGIILQKIKDFFSLR